MKKPSSDDSPDATHILLTEEMTIALATATRARDDQRWSSSRSGNIAHYASKSCRANRSRPVIVVDPLCTWSAAFWTQGEQNPNGILETTRQANNSQMEKAFKGFQSHFHLQTFTCIHGSMQLSVSLLGVLIHISTTVTGPPCLPLKSPRHPNKLWGCLGDVGGRQGGPSLLYE